MLHINIDGVSESPKLFHIHASGNLIQSKAAAIGRKCQETMNKISSIWNDNLNDRELSGLFSNAILSTDEYETDEQMLDITIFKFGK